MPGASVTALVNYSGAMVSTAFPFLILPGYTDDLRNEHLLYCEVFRKGINYRGVAIKESQLRLGLTGRKRNQVSWWNRASGNGCP